jgi:hypothetical protein
VLLARWGSKERGEVVILKSIQSELLLMNALIFQSLIEFNTKITEAL